MTHEEIDYRKFIEQGYTHQQARELALKVAEWSCNSK